MINDSQLDAKPIQTIPRLSLQMTGTLVYEISSKITTVLAVLSIGNLTNINIGSQYSWFPVLDKDATVLMGNDIRERFHQCGTMGRTKKLSKHVYKLGVSSEIQGHV